MCTLMSRNINLCGFLSYCQNSSDLEKWTRDVRKCPVCYFIHIFLFLCFFSFFFRLHDLPKNCDPVTVQLNRTCIRESTELENLGYNTHNITKRKVGQVNFFFFFFFFSFFVLKCVHLHTH